VFSYIPTFSVSPPSTQPAALSPLSPFSRRLAQGSRLRAQGSRLRAQGSGLRALGSELRVQSSGNKAQGMGVLAMSPSEEGGGRNAMGIKVAQVRS
jgi:hypothetical protein